MFQLRIGARSTTYAALTTIRCYVTKMHFIKGGSGLVTILDDMFGTEGTMDFLKDNFFEVNAEVSCEYL